MTSTNIPEPWAVYAEGEPVKITGNVRTVLPLKAFTVGPEDIFAAPDKAHALALANAITKPVPAYCIQEVEPVEAKYLALPWGESKETLQQRLEARTEPGYFAGWQD
ncbi:MULTISPECIES: hypothetical protein [unclassified Pseudomonas]|uniref:hypothetical protein n=1 Tax=unclassified Pseudomonas TaxID=196821 RepID=UPI0014727844|nr:MULTISPECIES: hypothetical protein [unclassified Pseudomonas]NMX92459.1 hypothetical protein [Pseudomonas sp. WS 5086]NMY47042.1 hypothetical protein [Pseudomonas sp. WS 5027]